VCVVTLDRYLLMRCYGDVSAADIASTIDAHAVCRAYRGSDVASVVLIDRTTQFPSEQARSAAIEMIKKTQGKVASSATVVLGDGFWASALRGVLTTFNLLPGTGHPTKTCSQTEEAVDWTLSVTGDDPSVYRKALIDAFATMTKPATVGSSSGPAKKK
jgi:hypothetical protein